MGGSRKTQRDRTVDPEMAPDDLVPHEWPSVECPGWLCREGHRRHFARAMFNQRAGNGTTAGLFCAAQQRPRAALLFGRFLPKLGGASCAAFLFQPVVPVNHLGRASIQVAHSRWARRPRGGAAPPTCACDAPEGRHYSKKQIAALPEP